MNDWKTAEVKIKANKVRTGSSRLLVWYDRSPFGNKSTSTVAPYTHYITRIEPTESPLAHPEHIKLNQDGDIGFKDRANHQGR